MSKNNVNGVVTTVPSQIAWVKLRDGAAIASKKCGVEFKSARAG